MTVKKLRLVRRDRIAHQIPAPLVALDQSLRGAPVDERREADTLTKARETLLRTPDPDLEPTNTMRSDRAVRHALSIGIVVLQTALFVISIATSAVTEWWGAALAAVAVTGAVAVVTTSAVAMFNLSRTPEHISRLYLTFRRTPAPRSDRVDRNHT